MKGKMQMARISGTILSGRSGRRGRRRQYLPGYGRKMSTKIIAHEPFPYQLPREGTKLPTKTDVGRGDNRSGVKETSTSR